MNRHVGWVRHAACALGLLTLGLVSAGNAQPTRIPGTSVTMTAPPGFRVSRNPPGLQNAETGSSIVIAELPPESYSEAAAVFSSPKTASNRYSGQGIRITRVEQLAVGAGQVPLAIGGQAENGREVRKYITVMGGDAQSNTKTTLITFSIAAADPLRQSDVEAAVRSVALARVPTLDEKLARLPFTFKAIPPFRTVDVVNEGTGAMLATFEGSDPSAAKPIIVISRAGTSAAPSDVPQMSERLIRGMNEFREAQVTEQKPTVFVGGEGYFMAAVSGNFGILQFTRVLPGGRYVRLFARGEPSALEAVRDAVAEIASSVAIPE
jgi:hypothetical protein